MSRPEVTTTEDKVGDVADPLVCPHPPIHHPTITVPYISPLVLRRELESALTKEGDGCLTSPACPSTRPPRSFTPPGPPPTTPTSGSPPCGTTRTSTERTTSPCTCSGGSASARPTP